MQASALGNEAIHGLVGPLDEAVGADGDHGVLHAVEQGFELALTGADGGKTFFDAAGGDIDGSGDAADFVLRSFLDASLEVAFGDTGGDINDPFEAASAPTGGDGSHQQSEQERQTRSQREPVTYLRGNGFDIGERIGEADSAAGDRNGDIEERNAEGGTAAFVAAGSAGESCDEFRTRGMVFHAGGVRLRIGKHFSGGVDDGDAGAGGLSFLSGDVGEGVAGAVGLNAVSEELGLLGQAAFDFGPQRGLPGAADHDIEDDGGGEDDE